MEKEDSYLPKWVTLFNDAIKEAKEGKIKYDWLDLNELAFKKLSECRTKNGIISFPNIWTKLCPNFSITKEQCWKLLHRFRDIGKIEIKPYHGVIIKDKFK